MFECLWVGESGRVEQKMIPSLPLLSCELSVSVKENPDRKKTKKQKTNISKAYDPYSPFRLTSLIYAEKFEFENPAIMEDKQHKQTEWFSVMAKGSEWVSLFRHHTNKHEEWGQG